MTAVTLYRSPCCGDLLDQTAPDRLACHRCRAEYRVEAFGPDLMPPDAAERYRTFKEWQAVQDALTAWRKRTWTGGADAKAATERTVDLAGEFVAWSGFSGSLLDVGCGSGWIRERMPAAVYHGVDPMPAEAEYPFPFARGLSDRLPYPDAAFDACCYWSSIDYAIDIDATLAEAHRVLKPGGLIAIATPIHLTKHVDGERLHNHRFLSGELEAMLRRVFGTEPVTRVCRADFHFIRTGKRPLAVPGPTSAS